MRVHLLAALALAMPLGAGAHADAFKPSKADQVKLGKQARTELRQKEKIVPNTDERVRLIRRVGAKLLATTDLSKEPWDFSFDLVTNSQINAFALPGGPVFLCSGLIDNMKTEDELAAVMAHEITHVTKEHWAYAYAEEQKRQLGLMAVLLIFRVGNTGANLLSLGKDVILGLPFSRRHESEADDRGLQMMAAAGYNPNAMADLFKMMEAKSGGGKPPEFLSSHPQEKTRVRDIQRKVEAMGKTFPDPKPLPWIARANRDWR